MRAHILRVKTVIPILLALVAIAVAYAEEPRTITTLTGERFDKAIVTSITAYGISITHSRGVAFVRFADLPDDVRKHYGYDPVKIAAADAAATAARNTEAAQQKREQEKKAEAERRDAPRKAALRRWASQNLMIASREDQLRAAMAAKFFEQRKGRPLTAAEYSFLDQDSKIALILYFPELLPPELTTP
jgi:ribosomal protein L12E/L44/L45/RPP1/RPP2